MLSRFDAFGKTLDDFQVQTKTGAILSLGAISLTVMLVLSELLAYRAVHVNTAMVVDPTRKERLDIFLNMTFPRLPCHYVNIDVMDVSGEQQIEVAHNMFKMRLTLSETPFKTQNTPWLYPPKATSHVEVVTALKLTRARVVKLARTCKTLTRKKGGP